MFSKYDTVTNIIEDTVVIDPSFQLGTVVIDPTFKLQKFENATQYAFSYLKEHFPSVTVNEDFSSAKISTTDLKKFLDHRNNHLNIMVNKSPEGIEKMDICRTILVDNKIRVYHSSSLARVLQKSMNAVWGSSILISAYETVAFSKTLPGNGAGLLTLRPLVILTVGTLIGVSLSFCETVMPLPFGKRLLSSASWFCLTPAKTSEALINLVGGAVVTIPIVSKVVSKLRIQDVKLNFTDEIANGPGASISDFKEGLEYLNAFHRIEAEIKK